MTYVWKMRCCSANKCNNKSCKHFDLHLDVEDWNVYCKVVDEMVSCLPYYKEVTI